MTTRRSFLLATLPAAALAAVAARSASAQAARLEETDPTAVALGYKHDAAKVDAAKFPTFAGACGAVGGKLVNAKGWCVAWVKKS